ncbi:MAG TPA: DUF1189 family protein, partial [Humisphaera sp.]|nr:DUF1189 family protein [Humisphaera sp.]
MQLPNPQVPWTPMQPPPPPRERRRYGAISALLLSFFSADFYRDVGRRWRGIGFWYLVWLMFITAIPIAVKAHIGFSKFARTDAQKMISTFPSLMITKGIVTSDPDPYLWAEPSSGSVFLYVDTTG